MTLSCWDNIVCPEHVAVAIMTNFVPEIAVTATTVLLIQPRDHMSEHLKSVALRHDAAPIARKLQ